LHRPAPLFLAVLLGWAALITASEQKASHGCCTASPFSLYCMVPLKYPALRGVARQRGAAWPRGGGAELGGCLMKGGEGEDEG
jgi:hypothetical protein